MAKSLVSKLPQTLVDAMLTQDTKTFAISWQFFMMADVEDRLKISQRMSEIGVDRLILTVSALPYEEWIMWGQMLNLLGLTTKTSAGFRRVFKAKKFVRRMIRFIGDDWKELRKLQEDTLKRTKVVLGHAGVPAEVCKVAFDALWVLCGVAYNSAEPQPEYWTDLFESQCFDFDYLITLRNNAEKDAEWKRNIGNLLQVLKYFHGCKFDYSPKVLAFIDKYRTPGLSDTDILPGSTVIQRFTSLIPENFPLRRYKKNVSGYIVFCSSPDCSKSTDQDNVFKHCAKCLISRYCCRNCQRSHWKHGHKKECKVHETEKTKIEGSEDQGTTEDVD